MTIMSPSRRKAYPSHRDGNAGVYRSKAARKPDALWRDVVAGVVFFTVLCISVTAVIVGGLLVFG
jgi:hypothetical protein